jgi:hypothetical protein
VRNRWRGLLIPEWDNTREFADHFSFTHEDKPPTGSPPGRFFVSGIPEHNQFPRKGEFLQ